MSMFQELDYTGDIKKVRGVQFSIMSPDEIRRRSVAEIYTNETFDGDTPKVGGIFDPRMGVLDHGKKCPTDELDNRHCPGYFGHIELARPVFNIHFQKYIIKTLQSVCPKCSKLYYDVNSPEIRKIISTRKGSNRFTTIAALCNKPNNRMCGDKNIDGCGAIFANVIKREPTSIGKLTACWKVGKHNPNELALQYDAADVSKIFKRISDEDAEALGFDRELCRPEWLICEVLPVAPPYVRPSVRADNNTRMEDDLTHKYCDIIKTNKTLKNKIANNHLKRAIDEWYQLLQYHVATLVNNSLPGIPPAQQRSGRPLKAINDRLKSKEGRVRGNLMGKRVDYTARSVITPDPRLQLDQLGVPIDICKNLTFPEKVAFYNYDRLSEAVKNGYHNYPGAKSIKRKSDGKIISLSVIDTTKIELQYGDIVNRHLIYNDDVLFNRQPSLHKMSMMHHRVVPLPFKTFRLNVSVTTPYNADFDGDEMNMHVPQSEESRIEIRELASVPTQIISPANNKPIISLVQDTCVGAYLFTRYDNYLTENEVRTVMIDIKNFDGILPEPEIRAGTHPEDLPESFPKYKYTLEQNLWSGRQLFTIVMPKVNFEKKNKSYKSDPSERNNVIINRGIIEHGVFDKNILGASEQGLIHTIYNDYGMKRTQEFLDDIQNIVTNFILLSGFSVGIGDLIPDEEVSKKMDEIVIEKKRQVIELIEHTHKGILEIKGGANISEEFENQILGILNKAASETGSLALKSLDKNNRMLNMIKSGSKGSDINIGQMIACVGQQAVDGKRIPLGFTDRTLPHFHKYDDGASARGFVESSFMKGLTPTEFFFHAMGGREGLIDTAVKTSETGYIQRRLIKGLEDARIVSDRSVRNANGTIIQFSYGEDGFDGGRIEKQTMITIGKNNKDILKMFSLTNKDLKKCLSKKLFESINKSQFKSENEALITRILEDRDFYFENFFKGAMSDNIIHYPVNFKRLIKNTIKTFDELPHSDLNPIYVIKSIEELGNLKISNLFKSSKLLVVIARIYLAPKKVCFEYKMSKIAFDYIIEQIKSQFYDSIAESGELVGTIAAQSIGEPSTQMTLNTFHFAGVASKSSVNQGVPRFKELLSVTENLKAPMNVISLKEPICYNKDAAMKVLNSIPITTLKELTKSTEIFFDLPSSNSLESSNEHHTNILDIYKNFEKLDSLISINEIRSPWVLSINFNKSKLLSKGLTMEDIHFAIISKFNNDTNDITCYFSDDNSPELIMRIQCVIKTDGDSITTSDEGCEQEDVISILKTLENTILNDIILSGIKDITGCSMEPQESYIKYIPEKGEYKKDTKWELFTDGSNLLDVLLHPDVDPYNTTSNNIWEIYRIFGIEAARKALFYEINNVFELSDAYVNSRHINLLIDIMTNRGSIMSIDRHGINKSDRGPLAKCSFEETPDILARAAIFGELDKVQSVSANIMMGQEVPVGTGSVDIIFDEDKYFENSLSRIEKLEETDDEEDTNEKDKFVDEYCHDLF
jgi:DNA-directed RNA polymerase II subunit RPB1